MAYDPSTPADRSKAILAVAAVYLGMAGLLLLGDDAKQQQPSGQAPTQMFDVIPPPPPPPPPPPKPAAKRDRETGAAGLKAEPTPIVVPPPKVALPVVAPLPAAPVAGSGSASSAGAASAGVGPGAGGAGDGRGAGGAGSGAGGIGEHARLVSGGLDRRDYRHLRSFAAPGGRAMLAILIGPDGRVVECSTRRSSGNPALDAALCDILKPRMRWAPARDRSGRALTVGLYYVATWGRE